MAAIALLGGCEGSATQTTTGQGLYGTLVDTHGNPVPGAHVKAWPVNQAPNGVSKRIDSVQAVSVETDRDGKYSLVNLDVGVYNIYGEKDPGQGAILIPKVKYLELDQNLGTDTLRAPGAIAGRVVDTGSNQGIALVFCYLQGSTYVAVTDSTGNFLLSNLPEGTYRMNYFADGYAGAFDSPVVVASGATTSLPAKNLARDLSLQPPAPQNITAVYDSVHGGLILNWSPVHVADLKGYLIQLTNPSDRSGRLQNWDLDVDATTGNADTTFTLDFSYGFALGDISDSAFDETIQIRARDLEGNLSPASKQPATVRITKPTLLNSKFTMKFAGGEINAPICRDTLKFALDMTESPTNSPVFKWSMRYAIGNQNSTLFRSATKDSIKISKGYPINDTLIWSWKEFFPDPALPSRPDNMVIGASLLLSPGIIVGAVNIPVKVDSNGCYVVGESDIHGPGKTIWY